MATDSTLFMIKKLDENPDKRFAILTYNIKTLNTSVAVIQAYYLASTGRFLKIYLVGVNTQLLESIAQEFLSDRNINYEIVDALDFSNEDVFSEYLNNAAGSLFIFDNLAEFPGVRQFDEKDRDESKKKIYNNMIRLTKHNRVILLNTFNANLNFTYKDYFEKFILYNVTKKQWETNFYFFNYQSSFTTDKDGLKNIEFPKIAFLHTTLGDLQMTKINDTTIDLDSIDINKMDFPFKKYYNIGFTKNVENLLEKSDTDIGDVIKIYGVKEFLENSPKFKALCDFLNKTSDDKHIIYTRFDDYYGSETIYKALEYINATSSEGPRSAFNLYRTTSEMTTEEALEVCAEFNSDVGGILLTSEIYTNYKNVDYLHVMDDNLIYATIFIDNLFNNYTTKLTGLKVILHYSDDQKEVLKNNMSGTYVNLDNVVVEKLSHLDIYGYTTFEEKSDSVLGKKIENSELINITKFNIDRFTMTNLYFKLSNVAMSIKEAYLMGN